MPKATVEKAVCEKCGADVRENTVFCYNCGGRVADDPPPAANGSEQTSETKAALDDLAARLKIEDDKDGKLAKAAEERKKARVRERRSNEYVWEPPDDSSSRLVILLAVLVTVMALAVVFLTVFWK